MTNEQLIWQYLKQHSQWTDEGIAGVMGNMQAESALIPNNVQNSYESAVGGDAEYTAKVDNGSYSRESFKLDSAGFGLAQWTYRTRKANLYDFAKTSGASIGDLEMQCAFCIQEMRSYYSGLNECLKITHDIRTAACNVLFHYEQPANQGQSVQDARTAYAQAIYDRQHNDAVIEVGGEDDYAAELEAIAERLLVIAKAMKGE